MEEKIWHNRLILLLLLTAAVYLFLKVIAPLTAPVLIAMLFVTIFGPLLQKLQRHFHVHRQIGAVFLLTFFCAILGLLIWILFSWIVGSLPNWIDGLDSLEQGLSQMIHAICGSVGKNIGIDSVYLEKTILASIRDGFDYFQKQFLPGMLSQSLTYARAAAVFGGFLLTFLIATVLLAKDYDDIMNRLLDREDCHLFLEIICGIIRYLATYVKAQLIIMNLIGILAAVVLSLCGIQNGILWGLLAGRLSPSLCLLYRHPGDAGAKTDRQARGRLPHRHPAFPLRRHPAVRRLGHHRGASGICHYSPDILEHMQASASEKLN